MSLYSAMSLPICELIALTACTIYEVKKHSKCLETVCYKALIASFLIEEIL